MRIKGLTTHLVRIDPSDWYGGAEIPPAERTDWLHPIVVVHTDESVEGYSSGSGTNGEGRLQAHALHDVYFPGLLGADPRDRLAVWNVAMDVTRHVYPASDAVVGVIDVAVWDIAGKALDAPISALLGGGDAEVPTYVTGSHWNRTPQDTFDEVGRAQASGHRAYKLTLGRDRATDEPFLRAASEAAGPGFGLMLDAIGRYSYDEALSIGRLLDELEFRWFEEPLPDRSWYLLGQLTERLRTPILTGETLRLREAVESVATGRFQRLRGDVQLKAGVTGLTRLVAFGAALGLPVEIHACTSPLLDVANLHVAAATRCCELFESHHPLFQFGMLGEPLRPDARGNLHAPTAPGLGVELDWDWIDDNTVETIRSGTT